MTRHLPSVYIVATHCFYSSPLCQKPNQQKQLLFSFLKNLLKETKTYLNTTHDSIKKLSQEGCNHSRLQKDSGQKNREDHLTTNLKLYYVSIVHDVVFSFQSGFSFFPTTLPATKLYKILVGNNFCLNKLFNKIRVNFPCCLRSS